MATHADFHKARLNGRSGGQFPGERKVNVDEVLEILLAASTSSNHAIRRAAHALVEMMADEPWRISAGLHDGGREADDRADANSHVTVSFGKNRSFHLQLAASGFLRNVTEGGSDLGVEQIVPWTPPGAPTERRLKRRS